MITIKLVCVGNLKEKFWTEACNEYIKRLGRFCKLEIVEVAEENKHSQIDKIKLEEGKHILEKLEGKVYLLDITGKQLSSEELAEAIGKDMLTSSTLTFIIGGSYGVSEEVKKIVKSKISFGRATYPHNLMRVILLEQLYRAFMINNGSSYHK